MYGATCRVSDSIRARDRSSLFFAFSFGNLHRGGRNKIIMAEQDAGANSTDQIKIKLSIPHLEIFCLQNSDREYLSQNIIMYRIVSNSIVKILNNTYRIVR